MNSNALNTCLLQDIRILQHRSVYVYLVHSLQYKIRRGRMLQQLCPWYRLPGGCHVDQACACCGWPSILLETALEGGICCRWVGGSTGRSKR